VVASCSEGPGRSLADPGTSAPVTTTASPDGTGATTTTGALSRPPFCTDRVEPVRVGTVASAELDEISGAALSRKRPGIMWLHNDSGNDAVLFAVTLDGLDDERVALPDLDAVDWEDIALGPGPDPAIDYLYIADIGDNRARRASVTVYRLPEPSAGVETIAGADTLTITYPGGPTEAETLLVDPVTGDIVIAGKALSGVTRLFGIPGDADWSVPQMAADLGEIRLGSFAVATGGDASAGRIVIRSYDEVFLWVRAAGESLADGLLKPGCRVASVSEAQGEAIALGDDGVFYTVSEGENPPIFRFG
jgi:hypothetical protein